jgi:hypothetical protein
MNIDPSALDHPVKYEPTPLSRDPRWSTIAVAALAAAMTIFFTWNGSLFG